MKKILLLFCVICMGVMVSNGQSSLSNTCPILSNTTQIKYSHHTNSGEAIYTSGTIGENGLIWDYDEARNNCHLVDSCKYGKEDFDELVKSLSEIPFFVIKTFDHSVGGPGYAYSFYSESKVYFNYSSSDELSENHTKVSSLIMQFIEAHPTECQLLFEKLKQMPHEKADFGTFKVLPKELEKYSIR